jgi:fatty-acyl-CoA synthase
MKQKTFKQKGFNLGLHMTNAAKTFPDKEAVVDIENNKRFTYKQLNDRVNKIANAFLELGVKKGDFIAVLLMNCSEFIELYYATSKIGAIIAPLNYRLLPSELAELINYSGAKTMIFGQAFTDVVNSVKKDLKVKRYVCVGSESPKGATRYEDLLTSCSPEEPEGDIGEHDPHKLEFTSGTTGLPKGYLLTHYQNLAALHVMHSVHDFNHNIVDLLVFPLYGRVSHAHALATVYARGKIVLMNFEPGAVLRTIEKEKITLSNWVPTMGQMILQHPDLKKYDLSSLHGITFAGSSLPESVLQGVWENITSKVYEYYGMQETAIQVAITPEMKKLKPMSCGAPVPDCTVLIVDDSGNKVSHGEIGEVVASLPSMTRGYYKEEEKSKAVFNVVKGWMHTGDLGRFDDDGYLYIEGRKKDIIISGAQNVFAPEVEAAIFSHRKVKDCAVIGLPDEKWGERIVAVVIPKSGETVSEEEITEHCRQKIAPFKIPRTVIFTDMIPRTPTGKVQKFILVDKYSKK